MARKRVSKKINTTLQMYLRLLREDNLSISKAFLFGSTAKGTMREDSDLDVAVISKDLSQSFVSTKYLLKKAHELGLTDVVIEPHGFHPREFIDANPLAYEIKKIGIRIE